MIDYEDAHYETVDEDGEIKSVFVERRLKPLPWFEMVMPWEEPRWGRGKLRWRRRHERIYWLERRLGLLGIAGMVTPMPWIDDFGGYQ